ncbi:hypothetical protein MTO96_006001 [Rhipicephalus appendiculatus]
MTAMAALVFLLALASRAAAYDVETTTGLGAVRGNRVDVLGRTLEVYRGVPYAQPPLGERRFRPPEPLQSWEGPIDATDRKIGCAQTLFNEILTAGVHLTEDCLHLNIWTPRGTQPGARSRTRLIPRWRLFVWLCQHRSFQRRRLGRQDWICRRRP